MARNVRYEDIHVGDKASLSKTISEYDVYAFAGVTGDFNPVHVNAEFAKNSLFKQRIAHGMISAGLISAVLGTELPGIDTIYMNQELSFLAPVLYGDTLTATVECIEKDDKKHRIIFRTTVTNQNDKLVTDGKARVMKR
ncbi:MULTISPECIES: MaoC family dehydratase [Megasphaera]|jgi:3-hydroxybutyryl-CoA dehydratase|uniref:MaoC family dehydratase n=1 Tax=Megasphaera intestinihominis TaxID=3133159 RepID=A0ABV1CUM9_9FIRM|nr:MaoC family dehydratase [Megasphaera sp.]MCH3902115.1 MaoC family dehydratase [Limosilactobacillus oris]MCH3932833.1 MaoC family dehydratase [Megasphaera sp.]MCI1888144.1 MaoC family dehydratase [Sporolactobacillus sp.]MCI1905972.1 MaoC family dehydratase [Enterococcaceae bacterium]